MTIRRGIPPLVPVLLLTVLLLTSCTADEPSPVRLDTVRRAPVTEVVEAPATVAARATATLRSPAQGTVRKLYVRDGQRVDKGQILAKISSPQAEDQLRQAREASRTASRSGPPVRLGGAPAFRLASGLEVRSDPRVRRGFAKARAAAREVGDPKVRKQLLAALDAAEAQHRAHQEALAKAARGLTDSLNRSLGQALSQVTSQLSAGLGGLSASMASLQKASRAQAKAAVAVARRTVDGLTVKAPFGGIVTLGRASGGGAPDLSALLPQGIAGAAQLPGSGSSGRSGSGTAIAVGVPVAAGDTVVTVTDVSELTLSADVDETDVLLVEREAKAEAEFDAVPGGVYPAEVTGVGVTPLEGATGGASYPVQLSLGAGRFDDGSRAPAPKPGMSAVVRLTVRESPDAVAVPSSAIVTSGRDSVVWVVRGGAAERRVVRLGAQGESMVEILSGLSPGERVVVRGADTVRQGQPLP
ncbi:HlyD family efflux transporter periplasmic adaptor subunit [Planomonospora sp. ID67723]|uniref:efflux RND transporter periplasmic adaptor subunit n=1 Tax=Planomonospora sp. ID67723 TaxID=2738134 RepID=UPI0018C449B8|nr:biotin/lipoyl-binding protein [Planomonospora sp. ID67723]MBG0827313.1 HlyD family efflux transporter periplasmic adaptor subunit [Planomonospora sp. ID67723]